MKLLGLVLSVFLIAGPLLALGEVKIMGKAWWEASRQSSGISPNPDEVTEAVIQVFAARAFSWRGILEFTLGLLLSRQTPLNTLCISW